jgi:acyl-CoA synthetase (AMP-forming)/AMP-acid ligase II
VLLHEMFDFHGRSRGDVVFAQFEGAAVTYGAARTRSLELAAGLSELGLAPGARIATLAQNSANLILLFLAASRAGLVVVPLNYRLSSNEITGILEDADVSAVFADARYCAAVEEWARGRGVPCVTITGAQGGWTPLSAVTATYDEHAAVGEINPSAVIFQMYTSGTTGKPKGALVTHRNIVTTIAQSMFVPPHKLNAGEATLVVLPLFHIAAISTALTAVACAATLVIQAQVDPPAILDSLERDQIVTASFVPAVIQFLISMPGIEHRRFERLRAIGYGASPIAEPVLRRALEVFDCDFYQGYGMTELAGSCSILSEADHRRALRDRPDLLLSAGKAIPGCEMKVVRPDGAQAAVGEVGEILVRGEQVMAGYWRRPEANAETLRGGWMHTGDAGFIDAEGYFFIRDRLKDMIVSGAENIYPAEIEAVLHAHPHVADVSVIGIPDDKWGETVMAVIVAKAGAAPDERDLDAFCRGRLGGFKVPRKYKFVDTLPRNPSGKVLKRELRAEFWQGRERHVS